MTRAARGFLRAAAVSLVAVGVCPVCTVLAAPRHVTNASPLHGKESSNQTPSFSGSAEAGGGEVTLKIYAGPVAAGTVIQELSTLMLSPSGMWSVGPTEPLRVGTYTAQAKQTSLTSDTGTSPPV